VQWRPAALPVFNDDCTYMHSSWAPTRQDHGRAGMHCGVAFIQPSFCPLCSTVNLLLLCSGR
jgi:hypothetical protein